MKRTRLSHGTRDLAKPKSAVSLAQPTSWDMGVRNPNQDRLKVVEALTEPDPKTGKQIANPNGVKRARRIDLLEYYFKDNRIDVRQYKAGHTLALAFEDTERSGEAIKKVQVDQTPDHGAMAAEAVDRRREYTAIRAMIPDSDWEVLECVALRNASVANCGYRGERWQIGLRHLYGALDRLAGRMGL